MSDVNVPAGSPAPPTLMQFLEGPLEQVRAVAPATVVWVVEGTRRSAALSGIDVRTDAYPRWTLLRMNERVQMFFQSGVRHVFTTVLTPSQFAEATPRYRERLLDWLGLLARDPDVLSPYIRNGFRLRLLGSASLPEIRPLAEELAAATPHGEHTLWCSVVAEPGAPWDELLQAAGQSGARTRRDAIRALYGEDIPLATMMVAFGKPVLSPDQVPPLLVGKMNCYWTQRPGYRMTERELRAMFYDHAYVRRTWRTDKTGRAEEALAFRRAWEEGPTLGLGMRLGPFWYPASTTTPADEPGETDRP
ncbi:hypothetical protein ACMHYB_28870 [Sorangium sp. So ce1128]